MSIHEKKQTNSGLHIFNKIEKNGVGITIGNKKYRIEYDEKIWSKFSKPLHKFFADNVTYAATWHLSIINNRSVIYHFDHPVIEPLFFKLLIYSVPMNIYTSKNNSVVSLIQSFYNSNFITEFKSLNHFYFNHKNHNRLKESGLVLFSFGKDSLLTLGLMNEVGIKPVVMFMEEPQSKYENYHKSHLIKRFKQDFQHLIDLFPVSFGHIRQDNGNYWGWDIILSQYILTLIPYCFYYRTKYIFLGNEQSCNDYVMHQSGFMISPVYEQSVKAMQLLQDIPKLFSIKTHLGSVIEPIHELFITYLLHYRYPALAKYQTSCVLEKRQAKKNRWCGACEKCARMYIFFKALRIEPTSVGFPNINMFGLNKKHYYSLFTNSKETSAYGGSGLGKDEQLLAFYLAYQNGVKGELISVYKKLFHKEALRRKKELISTYFGIHSSITLPPRIRGKILAIFRAEQKHIMKDMSRV
ncbi:hypothetical protein A2334_03950 [Candidatus Roizmanbacteria bacterium RIFOXYB2_FULL_38_10]|uniref:UDP-N-acetyl-alpha-D-muramoyl-L-alanyl-L-glutamate epimerase n=1 Tax=Candidatus Roizmanbacteria bacterium RIFOXYD1_FULL_38_12 TaxID=1802093 RepID=A0A1F7KZA5_9BACT|nr:MAG: hypothetical protein A3K47_00060 [Candidatus Roizmanbacteria bacterium RIFOXYA2_FULL_38_14]OGK63195.1 MAG: hypothetical protein A3K27_00060 [Candidatus Roizmanbacteria bacterium RIFOXYA1_FULL_37_12]OGK65041.1 MAG: hypothetical protein A3K38_00060 [Candidatus Roizmanbacteria bacterium RIFOXYB1_FULL_40_23]OGK68596.1 MAG: hypothetical protein A2334_03950 [Candidatus Roizmanbacteria bacterium RIFOXYB2_FULL_38_10]OGK69444.1 MAG: hypothetical protein A3K21_00060 [Candidatus Roizmanbacteria ba